MDAKQYTINGYFLNRQAELVLYSNDLISDEVKSIGRWAPHIHDLVDEFITSDSVVIEAGAYIGVHSVYISDKCKTLHAFEPLPSSYKMLEQNLQLNNCNNVELYNCGLSDKIGSTYFEYVNPENQGVAVLQGTGVKMPALPESSYSQEKVLLTTIDSLNLDQLDFIKVDAEGYDFRILEGGINTIKKFSPIIILEDWMPSRVIEKYRILTKLGYEATRVFDNDWIFVRPAQQITADLTIVVPIYLISDDLIFKTNQCLSSIYKYAPEAHIILVDDGSTYKPEEVLALKHYQLITHSENLGFAKAVNTGINNCVTDKILIMGNDLKFLSREPIDEAYKLLDSGADFIKLHDQNVPELNTDFQGFNCVFSKLSLYKEIGLLDTKFRQSWEDADFHERLKKENKIIKVGTPLGLYHYNSATNNTMQVKKSDEYWDNYETSRKYFNEKWGYPITMTNEDYYYMHIPKESEQDMTQVTTEDLDLETVFIDNNKLFGAVKYTGQDLEQRGLGGSETALIHLAEQFSNSTVYNYTDKQIEHNNVKYLPHTSVPSKPLFIQRSIEYLKQIPKESVLLLHDQVFDDAALLRHHLDTGNLKKIAVLSEYHSDLLLDHIGRDYSDYVIRYRNGSPFIQSETIKRNKNKFLYAHNPWRGLEALLKMWPSIKTGIPQAELHVFSGGFFESDTETQDYYDWLRIEYSKLSDVHFNNLVPEHELEKEYQTSRMYLYPGTTPETFGISALHAIATGTPIVMNAVWGLIETAPKTVAKHAFFNDNREAQFIAHIMRLYYDDVEWEILHNNTSNIDCSWRKVKEDLVKHV